MLSMSINTSAEKQLKKRAGITDTNLLLFITITVFFIMYACAVIFLKKGFTKPQSFLNILNENAALIILSCGMSLLIEPEHLDAAKRSIEAHHAAYHRIASLEGQIRPNRDQYC